MAENRVSINFEEVLIAGVGLYDNIYEGGVR